LFVIFKMVCKYCEQKLLLLLMGSSLLIGEGTEVECSVAVVAHLVFIPVYFNSCAIEIFVRGLFKLE
jgi:hypothetical protein